MIDRLSDRELVQEPSFYPLTVVYTPQPRRLIFERALSQIENVSPFLFAESVGGVGGSTVTVEAGVANAGAWAGLGGSRSISVTYNATTRTVTPDFSAVTTMAQVATAITTALNSVGNFNGAFSPGTYDAATQIFTFASINANQNITAFAASAAASLVQSGIAVGKRGVAQLSAPGWGNPSLVQSDHAFLVPGSVSPLPSNQITVAAGTSNPRHGRSRARTRSIIVTFNNVDADGDPGFRAVSTMDQVAEQSPTR